MSRQELVDRLETLITLGEPFTADDVTDNGAITTGDHLPNGKQNWIGALIQRYAKDGRIEFTGRVVKSRAPHRKGGMVRVWQPLPGEIRIFG